MNERAGFLVHSSPNDDVHDDDGIFKNRMNE